VNRLPLPSARHVNPTRTEEPYPLPLPAHPPARSHPLFRAAGGGVRRCVAVSCRSAADFLLQSSRSDSGAARHAASVLSQKSRAAAVEDHLWRRAVDLGGGTAQK